MNRTIMASLARLSAAFPSDHVPDSTLTLYASKLEGFDPEIVVAVVEDAIVNCRRFPPLADLRTSYVHKHQIKYPALTEGRGVPMPKEFKDAIAPALDAMDRRAEELNEGADA